MRGRLIFQFQAELALLDTETPDYDDVFREIPKVDIDGDGIGEEQRAEHDPILVPCQIEPVAWDALQLIALGQVPKYDIELVFHFRDLERLGLVDDMGRAAISNGDRLVSLKDRAGVSLQTVPTPPGLYVTEAMPESFGLCMAAPRRNLLIVRLATRGPSGGEVG